MLSIHDYFLHKVARYMTQRPGDWASCGSIDVKCDALQITDIMQLL
jgi:hypothetical protein